MSLAGTWAQEMGRDGFEGQPGGHKQEMGIKHDLGVGIQNSAPLLPFPQVFL